jgi:hypothetical protein
MILFALHLSQFSGGMVRGNSAHDYIGNKGLNLVLLQPIIRESRIVAELSE